MEFVYDRTAEDVERVIELTKKYQEVTITEEEKVIWNSGMKGAINWMDLNRIESNISAIASIVSAQISAGRTDWKISDIPLPRDYERIRENVQRIKDTRSWLSFVSDVPEHPINTYQKWNDIEKIGYDIYINYIFTLESMYRCGEELCAGEGVGIL